MLNEIIVELYSLEKKKKVRLYYVDWFLKLLKGI